MDDDPILRQRARALRLANTGQRVGYLLLGFALVLFFFGLWNGLTDGVTTLIAIAMGLAAVILAPAIILGYAAKAADREERTGKTGH
jgi:choline-glycine betaine transporter